MAGGQAACYGHLDYLENKPVISFEEERKAEPRGQGPGGGRAGMPSLLAGALFTLCYCPHL